MSSRFNRRNFLSRIGISRNPRNDEFAGPHSPRPPYSHPDIPPFSPAESFTFRLSMAEDIQEDLPPYSPRSPVPTEFLSPAGFTDTRLDNTPSRNEVVDEIVTRLQENLKNRKKWRPSHTGEMSFFWALRCNAETADVILEQLEHIKDQVAQSDWHVEKFTLIFKGQRLGDLLCRPIQTRKYNHTEPLKDDYLVVCIFKP